MTTQDAHDALADVLWWMKGFHANNEPGSAKAADSEHNIEQLRRVQEFVRSFRDEAKGGTDA